MTPAKGFSPEMIDKMLKAGLDAHVFRSFCEDLQALRPGFSKEKFVKLTENDPVFAAVIGLMVSEGAFKIVNLGGTDVYDFENNFDGIVERVLEQLEQ